MPMRTRGRKGYLLLAITAFLSSSSCDILSGPSYGKTAKEIEQEIFKLVNDYRRSVGKADLTWNDVIANEARIHSQDMADGKVPFGHDGFNERIERIKRIFSCHKAAEIIALAGTAKEAVNAWIASPEHRVNLEGDYDQSGVGAAMAKSGASFYATQIFIQTR